MFRTRSRWFYVVAACMGLLPSIVVAAETDFNTWVSGFKQEAEAKGISRQLLDRAFVDVSPNPRIIELDRKQPEGTMTLEQYLTRVVTEQRVAEGRRLMAQHKVLLERVSRTYGVQPRFIVALWGIETNFGKNTGGFSIVEALSTLAYDGRRSAFFRQELLDALSIIDAGHISLAEMKGSWAGALGQCQFMPSSFLKFAEDFDKDGRKDIWNDLEDTFASIANYLARSGWDNERTWGREVHYPQDFARDSAGLSNIKSLQEWQRLGIRTVWDASLPDVPLNAALVFPGDSSSRAFLVYNNYKTVLKWNRSLYFATAVGIFSDKLAGR